VDVSGNTTYTNRPCAQDESTQRISKSAAAVPGLDCRIANKLAVDTTRRMREGESSQAVYDGYGGINSLSPLVVSLISYVYSFDGNDTASSSRIATLATERCQVGSFGPDPRRCDVYPYEFIERMGGCDAAPGNAGTSIASNTPDAALALGDPESYTLPSLGEAKPVSDRALPEGRSEGTDSPTADCRSRLNASLEAVFQQMRDPQDVTSQDRLRERQRLLKQQLARC
jgi:hypothetical protein